MNAIIFGNDGVNSLGLIRSLGKKGHNVFLLVHENIVNYTSKSKYVKGIRIVRSGDDWLKSIQDLCTEIEGPIFLFATGDKEAKFNHAYGSILIKKDLLMSEIRNALSVNQLDIRRLLQSSLGKYSIYAYENKGYCAAISSINDYFEFNMDLMKKEVRDELFNPQRPIYTKVRDDAPSRYGLTSNVKNSIIAQGCVINGEVENCVISKGVYVGEGAKLSNCIVMQDTKIGCNTNLNYVIIDKDVTIKDGRSLMGYDSYPIYIAKKSVV